MKNSRWYWITHSDNNNLGWWAYDFGNYSVTVIDEDDEGYNKEYLGPFYYRVCNRHNYEEMATSRINATLERCKQSALLWILAHLEMQALELKSEMRQESMIDLEEVC